MPKTGFGETRRMSNVEPEGEILPIPATPSDENSACPAIGGYRATLAGALIGGVIVGLLVATVAYRSSSGLAAGIYAIVGFTGGFICGEVVGGGLLLKLRRHKAAGKTAQVLGVLLGVGVPLELVLFQLGSVGLVLGLLGIPLLIIGAPPLARMWVITDREQSPASTDDSAGDR